MNKRLKEALAYIGDYKFNSILVKNFSLLLIFMIVPMAILIGILFMNMNRAMDDEILISSQTSIERIADTIDNEFDEIKRLAVYIGQTDKVSSYVVSKSEDDPRTVNDIKDIFRMYSYVYDYVDSIYIYSKVNGKIITDDSSIETAIFEGFVDTNNHDLVITPRLKRDVYPYLISFARPMYTVFQKEWNGMVIVNVNIDDLGDRIKKKTRADAEDIMMIDHDGTVMFSLKDDRFMKNIESLPIVSRYGNKLEVANEIITMDQKEYVITISASEVGDWHYLTVSPLLNYDAKRSRVNRGVIISLIASVILSFLVALYMTVRSFSPVLSIINLLEEPNKFYRQHNTKEDVKKDEIGFIAEKILQIILSNDELRETLEQRIDKLNHAQMTALQAQINPHFLYNTLETIRWLAVELTHSENDASKMIESLSQLLRLSLESKEQVISIREELSHAQFYLDIMKVRYEDKLSVMLEVDEEIRDYKTVKLILQPLIENAIYHGVKPKRGASWIRITGRVNEESVILEVEDNGMGISKGKLEAINQQLLGEIAITNKHIGIVNVNQRIRIIFGKEYGVFMKQSDSGGVLVTVRMPKQ